MHTYNRNTHGTMLALYQSVFDWYGMVPYDTGTCKPVPYLICWNCISTVQNECFAQYVMIGAVWCNIKLCNCYIKLWFFKNEMCCVCSYLYAA